MSLGPNPLPKLCCLSAHHGVRVVTWILGEYKGTLEVRGQTGVDPWSVRAACSPGEMSGTVSVVFPGT